MQTKTAIIRNQAGLHARPVSVFVACAKKFTSKVTIRRVGSEAAAVNAKSAVMLLSQAFAMCDEVELTADGDDEVACIDALTALIESGFGET